MSKDAISCELHDYVEVVCMYGYQVRLILKNGNVMEGKAIDIVNSANRRECLVVGDESGRQQIELIQLTKLEVLTPNAKFHEVIFD